MNAFPKPFTPRALPWPLPALVAWAAAWAAFLALNALRAPALGAMAAGCVVGLAALPLGATPTRRLLIGGGFPASLLASGLAAGLPSWAWLPPLAALLLAYPMRAWRDAPLFPTPTGALDGLPALVPLAPGAEVLDAGCGLGHGLAALRRAYPQARFSGVEHSWPIALLARLRCPWARVRRGDMWAPSWQPYAMVYLFQRPESLPRAIDKARAELADGAWLASLEFEATGLKPQAVLHTDSGRPVWLYRTPFVAVRGKEGRSKLK